MKTIFNQKYNRGDYLEFLQNYLLPNDFQIKEEIVTNELSFTPNKIIEVTYLGKSDKLGITVYEMKHESENDPRVTLSREAFKIMANFSKRKALVFFVSENADNYRFSLITIDLKLEGKKITKLFSNPRRYSFLLGEEAKIGTLFDKLLESKNVENTKRITDFEDILNRFSVESVSKKFFTEYKRLFEEIKEVFGKIPTLQILLSKNENLNIDIFARKLLGQIVFIYFMQRKKWLGGNPQNKNWNDGKSNFLRWAFDYCLKNDLNFYEKFLESLFYKGLNEKNESFEFNGMFIKVPYLNGGLFEKFYEKDETLVIYPPNELFSNGENGILDIFDRYNFTIDENTFFEQDVAIDPEMLGKVFENLLDENLRKGKGAFYTPREIVSYMTRESLKNYLKISLQTSECTDGKSPSEYLDDSTFGKANTHSEVSQKIDHLFEYKDLYIENTKSEMAEYGKKFESQFYEMLDIVEEVNDKLKKIKTVDPAIGSGAFSIGLLHEIVSLRQYIEDQFLSNRISNYTLKKETIQNNIYGVDIDNGAVEIAKLRFWLSLVVDADIPEPLPNLDYKIMQGNSLIESFGGININQVHTKYNNLRNEKNRFEKLNIELEEEIKTIQKKFFEELSNTNKKNQELLDKSKKLDREIKKNKKELLKIAGKLETNSTIMEEKIIEHLHFLQEELYNCSDKEQKVELRDEVEETIVKIFHSKIEQEKSDYFEAETRIITNANKFSTNEQRTIYIEKERKELKKKFNFDYLALEVQLHEFTKKDKIRPFFPWHLYFADVFKDNDGFDIVIGNPPYIQLQKFSGQQIQKDYEAQKFESFAKTGDIYGLFYEKGNMLLKENGILTFITSNKWMRANYGKKLRKYFAENTQPIQLIDFGGYKVFESATVDTNILIFKKSTPTLNVGNKKNDLQNLCTSALDVGDKKNDLQSHCTSTLDVGKRKNDLQSHCTSTLYVDKRKNDLQSRCTACTIREGFARETDIAKYVKENGIELSNLSEESWIISTKEEFAIKQKIEKIGTPLKDWDISINYGIKTGFNEAFIISGAKKDELIAKDPKSAEIIKPILRGRDIKRYKAEFADLWLIATHNGYKDKSGNRVKRIDIEKYPAVKEHLDNYWNKIFKRYDKGATPYNLRNCAYYEEFEKDKIVWAETGQELKFWIDKNCFFLDKTTFLLRGKNLNYLLGLLNSKAIDWMLRTQISAGLGKSGLQLAKIYVERIPLPKISKENQKPFENLVDKILQKKEQHENTTHLENQIDLMVYKLYDLTYEEVKIVDADFDKVLAEFGLNKDRYEKMSVEELGKLEI